MRTGGRSLGQLAGLLGQLALATLLAAALGLSAAAENYLLVGFLLGGAAVFLSALNWRRHLIPVLFAFVCVEGLLSLLLRGRTMAALLLKDFLVLIAYFSFLADRQAERRLRPFRLILPPMAVLGLLGLAQVFNPELPNLLVGLVGFKVMFFYMPLAFLGYACFRNLDETQRFFRYLLILSIPVSLFAAAQYAIGPASLAAMGKGLSIATVVAPAGRYGQHLRAIGTFAASDMLALYCTAMVGMGIITLGLAHPPRRRLLPWMAVLLACMALLTSGSRGGAAITLAVAAAMLLSTGRYRAMAGGAAVAGAAGLLVAGLLGGAFLGRMGTLLDPATWHGRLLLPVRLTWSLLQGRPLGGGLGCASVGARHVMPTGQPLMFIELFLPKTVAELGLPGLLACLWLYAAVLVQAARSWRQPAEADARRIAAGLAVFIVGISAFSLLGGMASEKPPLNVYFWFFLGAMIRMPELRWKDAGSAAAAPPPAQAAP